MLWAAYQQTLNPLRGAVLGSFLVSCLVAAVPVVVLFWLLVPRRWVAPRAGAAAALVALAVAVIVYRMPPVMAVMAFLDGAAFGLLPVGWTIFNTMLLYNLTVEAGQFAVVRRSVAGLSGDARIQAILIGFAFGAFLEGAAGGGTPVAICGAILVGLGFEPFLAAVLCLIANTSPVAFGGLGTPLIVLGGVTGLPTETLSVMAGHQLPLLSMFVPLYMVKCMCSWRQTFEVWPALAVSGVSFAVFQYTFATIHTRLPGVVLYPMTDIGGGIFSLVVTAVLLQFWRPRKEWHFSRPASGPPAASRPDPRRPGDAHAAETAASVAPPVPEEDNSPPGWKRIGRAWTPFALMSLFLVLTGLVRQEEGRRQQREEPPLSVGPVQTLYKIPIPALNDRVYRDPALSEEGQAGRRPEKAEFDLAWLTAPGTAVFLAALVSVPLLRISRGRVVNAVRRTVFQMRIPIPTICFMLGLSYVTRYAGMDATLGYAFSGTGAAYPFFAAFLGWLGVFLTGTDAGSNALFGSLQKITATQIFQADLFRHLGLGQLQVLISTANSTGGVMGKMIDAQSICVATAATHQLGREADIFKAVVWHSILLAAVVGLITLLQAYVPPLTGLVPHP